MEFSSDHFRTILSIIMAKNFFLKTHSRPIIIAHRGASGEAPENTMASFKLAIKQRADAIELDVQRTKDGRLIIMHDPLLGRTNNGHGQVARKKLHELHKLDAGSWFDPQFSKERIPTLGDTLDTFKKSTNYVIELKFYQRDRAGFARQVYEMVAQRGLLDNTMFLSFSVRILDAIKARDAQAVTCLALLPLTSAARTKATRRHDVIAVSSQQSHIRRHHSKSSQPINAWLSKKPSQDVQSIHADMITTNWPQATRAAL